MKPEHQQDRHAEIRRGFECGSGTPALIIVPVLLAVLFVVLAAAAVRLLVRGAGEPRPPAPAGPVFQDALPGLSPALLVIGLLAVVFLLLMALLFFFCCCRKGAGLGQLGVLLAPLVCPIIEALRGTADALDLAGGVLTRLDAALGVTSVLTSVGDSVWGAGDELERNVKVPRLDPPGTDGLFNYVNPIENLGDLFGGDDRPGHIKVLTGDFPANQMVTPDGVAVMAQNLKDAGSGLRTAGANLRTVGEHLQAAAASLRRVVRILEAVVPCEGWTRLGMAPGDAR